eukprot:scaffold92299_cov57-Phaeocystis_antarctica.AAC.1
MDQTGDSPPPSAAAPRARGVSTFEASPGGAIANIVDGGGRGGTCGVHGAAAPCLARLATAAAAVAASLGGAHPASTQAGSSAWWTAGASPP